MPDPSLAHLTAPTDPRASWDLPAWGTMPVESDLDELVSRVLAPNASHMTLDGTNTYVMGVPGSGAAVVVDPGPPDADHKARVDAALARRDAQCSMVLVTHHHIDHAEAAQPWAAAFGAVCAASTREVAGDGGRVLGPDEVLHVGGGLDIEVLATPGHCHDHTAFRLPSGTLLTGDHVLGRGTAVVAWPDGDLAAYVESLRKVLDLGPDVMLPGHGPELAGSDPMGVVRYYLEQRAYREAQILAVLGEGPHLVPDIVARAYADVDQRLWGAAGMSTRAALAKLVDDGRVVWDPAGDPPAPARLA